MARHLRIQFEGAVYHVTARGNAREKIYFNDRDYVKFIEKLSDAVFQYDIRLYLFCLMPNHFHLVLETPRANLSRFMQSLQTAYAVYFNLKHSFTGHLLQGRFAAKLVAKDRYFLKLCRYVDLNPVHVQTLEHSDLNTKIRQLTEYRWSSFRSYVGLDAPCPFVDYGPLLALVQELAGTESTGSNIDQLPQCANRSTFDPGGNAQGQTVTNERQAVHRSPSDPGHKAAHGSPSDPARQVYRNFVLAGLAEDDEDLKAVLKGSPVAIGSTDFVHAMEKRYEDLAQQATVREDVALRRRSGKLTSQQVLEAVARAAAIPLEDLQQPRGPWEARALAGWLLVHQAGLTQRAAARELGLTQGSAVSHMLRELRVQLQTAPALNEKLQQIQSALRQGQTVTDDPQPAHRSPSDPLTDDQRAAQHSPSDAAASPLLRS